MGGRLDATNVVQPILCLITNIGMDHTQYLGDSLEKIAAEKAGIIKNDVPVIVGELDVAANEVILDAAQKQDAPVSQPSLSNIIDLGVTEEGKRHIKYVSPQQSNEMLFSMVGSIS